MYLAKLNVLKNSVLLLKYLLEKMDLFIFLNCQKNVVGKVEDVVKIGDEILVKVMEIDKQGRVNLSRKAMLKEQREKEAAKEEAAK